MTMLQKVLIPATSLNVTIIWMVQTKLFSNYNYMLLSKQKFSVIKKEKEEFMIFFYVAHSESVRIEIRISLLRLSRLIILVNPTACNNVP